MDRAAAFERFLAGVMPRPRPTLHFIHSLLPHTPFAYLPGGRVYTAPQKLAGAVLHGAVARRIARFGAGSAWSTLFTRVPHAEMIGEPVGPMAAPEEAPYTVRLWDGMSRDLRENGPLPAYVEGALRPRGAATPAPLVAIAVNGTIASTARTVRRAGGELAFHALVSETLLRRGENRYEVFVIDDRDPLRVQLARVPADA